MMKRLSKENIQFIDTYLKNSDVNFIDIRVEMIDHVASAIEGEMNNGDDRSFYQLFKIYMVENKSELIKSNNEYFKVADRKIWKSFFKKSISLQGLVVFLTVFLSFNVLESCLERVVLISIIHLAPFTLLIMLGVFYFFAVGKRKKRYSALERIGFYYILVFQGVNMFFNPIFSPKKYMIYDFFWLKITSSLLIFILIILTLLAFEFNKKYQLKY